MQILTDRLLLRPLTINDWEAAHEYAADPEVSLHQAWGPNTEEQTRGFVQHCVEENAELPQHRTAYHFAVVLQASQTFLGSCTLRVTDPELREAMIGYTLNRRYWNQGYTTEVARALLAFGFGELELHRILSWCTPENVGSWRVMEKAGMRREGHEREATFFKGEWRDWHRYAVLDHEWKRQHVSCGTEVNGEMS